MKSKSPTMPCKFCKGSGQLKLSQENLDTLEAFGQHRYRSCADLRATLIANGKLSTDKDIVMETIIHKRVDRLVRWGILKRVKQVTPKKNGEAVRLHRAWVFKRV